MTAAALLFGGVQHHHGDFDRRAGGHHPVAWAFLRLAAVELPCEGQLELKLQLYKYDTGGPLQFRRGEGMAPFAGCHAPSEPPLPLRRSPDQRPSPAAAALRAGLPSFAPQQPLPQNQARRAYAAWRTTLGNEVAAAAATPVTQGTSPLAAAILAAAADAAKYQSALHVSVAAVPRPEPDIVVTEPSTGRRPCLPAGYGSGFETGASDAAGAVRDARQRRLARSRGLSQPP